MNPELEIKRLVDIMPASGRMTTKIISKPQQSKVIHIPFPYPWIRVRHIHINFELWRKLTQPQRDLLLLAAVNWISDIKWFELNLYQGIFLIGGIGTISQILEGDLVGIIVSSGLSAIAGSQIWLNNNRSAIWIESDKSAIQVAMRRGYAEQEAAQHLLTAIETIAQLEPRTGLEFIDLLRCQNLKTIIGNSSTKIPQTLLNE